VFLAGNFLFTSSDTFCCRIYRLATNGEQADWHQKQTSVRSCKLVNTDADHGCSKQRFVAIPYVVRSTIGYHSNIRASCSFSKGLVCPKISQKIIWCFFSNLADRLASQILCDVNYFSKSTQKRSLFGGGGTLHHTDKRVFYAEDVRSPDHRPLRRRYF